MSEGRTFQSTDDSPTNNRTRCTGKVARESVYPKTQWYGQQSEAISHRKNAEAKLAALDDKYEAVQACYEAFGATSAQDLVMKIQDLFSDESRSVILSTVHKAKGLEAERVYLLEPQKMPLIWQKQQPWQLDQEMNIKYVALTRATSELYFVA